MPYGVKVDYSYLSWHNDKHFGPILSGLVWGILTKFGAFCPDWTCYSCEQVDIWRRAWILFSVPFALSWTSSSLDPRIGRASTACYLLYIMSYSKMTISQCWVGIRKTTQGNVVCCSWRITQHVPFCSKAPRRRFVGLRRFKTIFDCCRVFEGAKSILYGGYGGYGGYGVSFWFPSLCQSADSTRSWNTEHLYTTLTRWAAVSLFDSVTA